MARDWRRRTGSRRRSPRRRRRRARATPGDVVGLERLDHLAPAVEPLADLVDPVARQQHLRRGRENVEHVLAAPLPADLVDVAEAARGQQAGAHALAFEQGVERGGRAVQDQRHRIARRSRGQDPRVMRLHHGGRLAPDRKGTCERRRSRPASSSNAVTSVKVPPTSMPIRNLMRDGLFPAQARGRGRRRSSDRA